MSTGETDAMTKLFEAADQLIRTLDTLNPWIAGPLADTLPAAREEWERMRELNQACEVTVSRLGEEIIRRGETIARLRSELEAANIRYAASSEREVQLADELVGKDIELEAARAPLVVTEGARKAIAEMWCELSDGNYWFDFLSEADQVLARALPHLRPGRALSETEIERLIFEHMGHSFIGDNSFVTGAARAILALMKGGEK